MDVTTEEQRAFIKIQFLLKVKPPEIHANLVEACGEAAFGLRNVQKWCKRFEEGSSDTKDAARCGRPISATDLHHVQQVEELLLDDRRWTCEELGEKLDIALNQSVCFGSSPRILACGKWLHAGFLIN